MSLTTEEHHVLLSIEKQLETMNGLLLQLCEKLTPVVGKSDEEHAEGDDVGGYQWSDKDLKQFLTTKSKYTREDKCRTGYIIHDLRVHREVVGAFGTVPPGEYSLFIGVDRGVFYICSDDCGVATLYSSDLDVGVRHLAYSLQSGVFELSNFKNFIETKNKKENHGA